MFNGWKNYYQILPEDNEKFSLGIDEGDKMVLSVVDHTSKDTIINSIEQYYQSPGGMCL